MNSKQIKIYSKLFKALIFAFLIIAGLLFWQAQIAAGTFFILLAGLCFYLYKKFSRKAGEKTATNESSTPETDEPALTLKQDLTADFRNRHGEAIAFLIKGFNYDLKQIVVEQGEDRNFISDKNEWWCCLQGRGILNSGAVETCLIPNAIITMAGDGGFSFVNDQAESIEILVLET